MPECQCKSQITDDDEFRQQMYEYVNDSCCWSWKSLMVNLIKELWGIKNAIISYIASQPVIVAQGVVDKLVSGYGNLTNNTPVDVQFWLAPLDYEIIGIGVSYLGSFGAQGSYTTDDQLLIKFWNYTSNTQIGNTLTLTDLVKFARHTNLGQTIGANVAAGNICGVKITYINTEGSTYPMKPFEFQLFVKPVQLQSP